MVKCFRECRNQSKRMTRTGKIARLPAALREELNQRPLDGKQGKQLVFWPQRIMRILGLGVGYDASKNPELTLSPVMRASAVKVNTSEFK
jgi:hypothetical protein